jgi:hypothetical protein
MRHKSIKVSDQFDEAVQRHMSELGVKSWTRAMVDLATVGISEIYGETPQQLGQWGGDRRSSDGG